MRILFLSVLALMFAGLQALAEERYALVFGNESYDPRVGVLSNPHEDAEKVAAALRQVGFEVIGGVRKDADRAAIWAGIYELQSKLTEAGPDATGFVFYAGHGGSHEARGIRSNYLIPVGPAITGANQLPALGVDLGDVIGTLEKAKAQSVFIVLDACRNTLPWTTNMGGAQPDRGWSEPEEVAGMLLSYSTADGATAPDDGVFADVLARHLVKPNLSADRMFTLVGREVARKRKSTRRPAVSDQLRQDFFFAGRGAEPPAVSADALYWLQVTANRRGQQICDGYRSYLSSFPNGTYSNRARQLLSVPPCQAATSAPSVTLKPPEELFSNINPSQTYAPGSTFRDPLSGGGQGPEMVIVPAGSFMMGSPKGEAGRDVDEGPQRRVTLSKPFAVGKFEVTWAEWEACVADGGCESNLNKESNWGNKGDAGWGKGTRPVINVSWEDAHAYVTWLSGKTGENYRLLSEAEWEYAARAGSPDKYSWGNDDPVCRQGARNGAVLGACEGQGTKPVGFSAANTFGLYDLHGNVWEWVEDCYVDSYSGAPTNGAARTTGECRYRVFRGGSWDYFPHYLRSAYRVRNSPDFRDFNLGFRVTRTLP